MQLDELDETVTVTLSGPSGTVVTPVIGTAASATTTIIDNDDATSISIAAPMRSAVDEAPAPSPSRSPAPATPQGTQRSTTR